MSPDVEINDFAAAILLRYFRGHIGVGVRAPRIVGPRDLEALKSHWSMCRQTQTLLRHVVDNPHEVQQLLTSQIRATDAGPRGRIDARLTLLHGLRTGSDFATVFYEPTRTYTTGANQLLAWVLNQISTYNSYMRSWHSDVSPFNTRLRSMENDLGKLRRIEALRQVARTERPTVAAYLAAKRSRQKIYQLASDAFDLFSGIERADPDILASVLTSTLLEPAEDWRRFELAVGLAAAEALALHSNEPLSLGLIMDGRTESFATVGRYKIYWQQLTDYYQAPALEPSESVTESVLAAYGMSLGSDRPDFVVVDQILDKVVSIIEVKYSIGLNTEAQFKDAIKQLVRYFRGYGEGGEVNPLACSSLVALSHSAPTLLDITSNMLQSVDFLGIKQHGLLAWARRLVPHSADQLEHELLHHR